MHLTLINFFKKTVPGHIFRGKRRLVRIVTPQDIRRQIQDYQVEEENMLYLRHPYLTQEQSSGHAKSLGKTEKKIEFWNNTTIKPFFKPHVKIEDRLKYLKLKEVWD